MGKRTRQIKSREELLALHAAGLGIINKYTCGILNSLSSPTEIASGTVIKVGKAILVATASHALEGLPLERIVLCCNYKGTQKRVPVPVEAYRTKPGWPDVALIRLRDNALDGSELEGLPIERLLPAAPNDMGKFYMMCGCPADEVTREGETLNVHYVHHGLPLLPYSKWPKRLSKRDRKPEKATDFFFQHGSDQTYQLGKGKVRTVNTHGMSGGGVWLFDESETNGVWRASPRLIGVVVSRDEDGKAWVRANKIDTWIALAHDTQSDLKAYIETIFIRSASPI